MDTSFVLIRHVNRGCASKRGAGGEKRFEMLKSLDVAFQQKVVGRLYLWNIVISTVVCENHLTEPDMI